MVLDLDQLLLPFAEREYIDAKRAARILGLSHRGVLKLCAEGRIETIDYGPKKRKRVRYAGIVALCDELRRRYCVADRRPRLDAPYLRHLDRDLLPFPLDDTLSIEEAKTILGYSSKCAIMRMIEEGRFEAYMLATWRISRQSLGAYIARVQEREHQASFSHRGRSSQASYM